MKNQLLSVSVILKRVLLVFIVSFSFFLNYSCDELEELLGLTEEEETTNNSGGNNSGGSSSQNAAYKFTYNCPSSGTTSTITIPKGTTKCQKAQEYFAKTYGCNDVNNFNTANCRVCNDCDSPDWKNYCSICN